MPSAPLRIRMSVVAVACAVVAAACGGGDAAEPATFPEGAFALRANIDIVVGTERLLVGVRASDGGVLGSPDDPVDIEVRPVDDPEAAPQRAGAEFTWIIEGATGLYRAEFAFDQPGVWQATVIPAAGPALEPTVFSVLDPSCASPNAAVEGRPTCAVQVGEPAPRIASPTLAGETLENLTTDPDPDERFYQLSLGDALGNGRPTVVVFATPAFCQTAACGPLLDITQAQIDDHPDVDFVHVEVYTGFREPDFDPADPARLAPAIAAYRLVNEPWVFVVGADGVVTARFEGVMDAAELVAALGG